jgi:hypothetical protein
MPDYIVLLNVYELTTEAKMVAQIMLLKSSTSTAKLNNRRNFQGLKIKPIPKKPKKSKS